MSKNIISMNDTMISNEATPIHSSPTSRRQSAVFEIINQRTDPGAYRKDVDFYFGLVLGLIFALAAAFFLFFKRDKSFRWGIVYGIIIHIIVVVIYAIGYERGQVSVKLNEATP